MKLYRFPIVILIAAFFAGATECQETHTNWNPNSKKLAEAAKYADPITMDAASILERDLTRFYELLHDKKWRETYQLRAKAFQEDFPETDYLAAAKKEEKLWGLVSYDVLSVNFETTYGSTNVDQAMLVCKFIQLPHNSVSYAAVYWHRENAVWKCLNAGPNNLSISIGTRIPYIDWK